jgi:hypothetical protein
MIGSTQVTQKEWLEYVLFVGGSLFGDLATEEESSSYEPEYINCLNSIKICIHTYLATKHKVRATILAEKWVGHKLVYKQIEKTDLQKSQSEFVSCIINMLLCVAAFEYLNRSSKPPTHRIIPEDELSEFFTEDKWLKNKNKIVNRCMVRGVRSMLELDMEEFHIDACDLLLKSEDYINKEKENDNT